MLDIISSFVFLSPFSLQLSPPHFKCISGYLGGNELYDLKSTIKKDLMLVL